MTLSERLDVLEEEFRGIRERLAKLERRVGDMLPPAPYMDRKLPEPAPDREADLERIVKNHVAPWTETLGPSPAIASAIRAACREYAASVEKERIAIQADRDNLWSDYKKLQDANIERHEEIRKLQADLASLRARAVPTEEEISEWIGAFQEVSVTVDGLSSWLRSRLDNDKEAK